MIYEKLIGSAGTKVRTFVKVTDDGVTHVYYDGMHPADGPIVIWPGHVLQIEAKVADNFYAPLQYAVILLDKALPGPNPPSIATKDPNSAPLIDDL